MDNNALTCRKCSGRLKYYDSVRRIVRMKERRQRWIKIRRFRCPNCGCIHRDLPDDIFPYKQYEAEIIRGVIDGFITCQTIGYEDYPCEMTMIRWKSSQNLHLLL